MFSCLSSYFSFHSLCSAFRATPGFYLPTHLWSLLSWLSYIQFLSPLPCSRTAPIFGILFGSCRYNLSSYLWWYSLELLLSKFLLQPAWSVSFEFLLSDCFGPCLLCNQLSSDVPDLDCLFMLKNESLRADWRAHAWGGRCACGCGCGSVCAHTAWLGWKWPLSRGVPSITIYMPFVWGCWIPPEKNPWISRLGENLLAGGLQPEQPRDRAVTIQVWTSTSIRNRMSHIHIS